MERWCSVVQMDPGASFKVVLTQHQSVPEPQRPALWFRAMTRRDVRLLVEIWTKFNQLSEQSPMTAFDAIMLEIEQFLTARLRGWENQVDEGGNPLAFNVEDFDRIVSDVDLVELLGTIRRLSDASARDRKKSALPSPSPAAASVPLENADSRGGEAASTHPA